MDNVQLNIDEIVNGLVMEIANLKKELVIEKARSAALAKMAEEPAAAAE
jgi:hypothetical protein